MRVFSKEDIDATRSRFIRAGYAQIKVDIGGRGFRYFIIPEPEDFELPNFVMRLTGRPEDGYVLGVSDHIDPRMRAYVAAHEYIEFVEIGPDVPDRCIKALQIELELVPKELLPDYVAMRADFFRRLVPYCESMPDLYSEDDVRQFRENRDTLNRI